MATDKPIRVAIIGLGFGAEFIPIYQAYPGAEMYAICRRSKTDLDECGDRWKIAKRYTEFADVLKDPDVDAVHINSPIQDHALAVDRRARGRQARRLHGADGHDDRGMRQDRRGAAEVGQGLHDDGDGRLQS